MRRLVLGGLAFLAVAAPAEAQRLPVYRDPPSYRGLQRAPATAPEQLPPLPPSSLLSETGQHPDVLVDEAGTAHVTWREGRGDLDDAAIYCRVKRGSAACEQRVELTWSKPYGAGDSPSANTDYGGPEIVRLGEQLVIFSKRYPTVAAKPDGASSHTVVAWTSSDGGNTWSGNGEVVGKRDFRHLIVAGPGDDPSVLAIGNDGFCRSPGPSAWCLVAYRAGQYATDDTNLSTQANQNYNAGIALDELGHPVSVATDAGGNAFARRWGGAGSFTDAAAWGPATSFVADDPEIAGGRSGVWMISKTTFNSGPFSARRLNVGGDGTLSPGPPAVLSKDRSDLFAAIHVDPAGRVHAAWVQRSGDDPGVHLRSSNDSGFGPDQRMGELPTAGGISLAAAEDGGGFLAYNRNQGANDGGVVIAGFGQQAATGRPGIGGLAGGEGPVTNVTCKQVDFGSFKAETAQGCFLNGTGANARMVVTTREFNLHGVRIIPDPGARVVIDPRTLRIDSIGNVRVLVSGGGGDFLLWHGEIHRDLKNAVPGSNLFEFPAAKFKANLFGFPVESDIPVKLQKDGVHIPISVELPPAFGGFAGKAEVVATPGAGMVLDSLRIHIGPVLLGALTIETIDVNWRSGGSWDGRGRISVPAGGRIDMDVQFENGEFKGAGFGYTLQPPATVGPFVYLLYIGGRFELRPVKIQARGILGAGAAFRGEAPVKVDGMFTMTFPPSGPADFTLTGRVELFMFRVGGGYLKFQTDGYAAFGGDVDVGIGPAYLRAKMDGFIDGPSGQFGSGFDGKIGACLVFPLPTGDESVCGEVGGRAAINNTGFAACARINPPNPLGGVTAGIAFDWDELNPAALYNTALLLKQVADIVTVPCSTGRYDAPPPRPVGARAAQAGARAFAVGRGLPTATFLVKGEGGRPNVTVRGPGGATVATGAPSRAGFVAAVQGADAAWIVLTRPAAGTWTITPNEGSPAIAQVLLSKGYRPAKPRAKVSRGRVAYRIASMGAGQKVTFAETGRFGTRVLGTVARSRGTLRFRPAPGPGGRRTIVARVLRAGRVVTDEVRVGSYVAPPPPRPGAVRALRARKRGSSVTVSFRPGRGAARTEVKIRSSTGKRLAEVAGPRARKVRFGALRWDKRFTVTARSFGRNGRAGPLRRTRLRAR